MKKFLIALTLLLSVTTCAGAEPVRTLSKSVNAFCWKYFATLDRKDNIVYSPYGIHTALSILANGASGDTRKEILAVLGTDDLEGLNDARKNFSAAVKKNYRGEKNLGEFNLMLINDKIFNRGLDENFKRVATNVYESDVRKADFAGNFNAESQKISRWVADKTDGFVTNFHPTSSPNAQVDIFNLVYFNGKWAVPFKVENTREGNFNNLDGSRGQVSMMNNVFKDEIAYHADDKFKGIALPYTANAAMYLILPVDNNALNVAEMWNAQTFAYRADFLDALKKSSAFDGEVVVRIPNSSFEFEDFIVRNFLELGIRRAFTDDAEFNIVKDTPLKISSANTYTKIDISEEGTEAAAVTEVTLVGTSFSPNSRPPRKVYFVADRPFLFVIRDVESGVILFAGVMNKF